MYQKDAELNDTHDIPFPPCLFTQYLHNVSSLF